MRVRAGFFLTCAASALVIGAGSLSEALAADQLVVKAQPVVEGWWYHGYLEAGGRFFLNNPPRNGSNFAGDPSLAKYYEYSTIKPGPFLDGHVAMGSNNGLYQVDLWGQNVGYSDQAYRADVSKAGQHYLTFGWDQTPHVYSTSALTLYNGVGGNALTLPPGLSALLFAAAGCIPGSPPTGCVSGGPTAANVPAVRALISQNLHQTDIGIRRDTASVDYRYTPTDAWDIKADYSHMRRSGTQVEGVVFSPGTSGVRVDAPMPVADSTQNFGVNGEYVGTSPWSQRFNVKLGYNGSVYKDDFDSYTIENPFCPAGAIQNQCARNGSTSSPIARMSLWPDNQANTFSGTLGADLPGKSRYIGTVSYAMMRQNQAFLPYTITPNILPASATGQPWNSTASLPALSLNGSINTLLSNNVVTTQITPDLKSKLSYRYYNFDNGTSELTIPDYITSDTQTANASHAQYAPVRHIAVSYTKQNAGAELNWHPTRTLNVGAAYGYEQYKWTRADVDVTNENSGKVFADWKPTNWITARGSLLFSARRFGTYDYLNNVGRIMFPDGTLSTVWQQTAYRQFAFGNRDRNKAQLSVAVDLLPGVTVTPTFGWRNDNFKLGDLTEEGLKSDRSYSAGVELAYLVNPDTKFLFSYMNEHQNQVVKSAGGTFPFTATSLYEANVDDKVNTFVASVDHALIPNRLNLTLGYTVSYAVNNQPLIFANGAGPSAGSGGQFPDVKTNFQRFDALAKYTFDKDVVRQLGWTGEVSAKLRYAWEHNSVANWQIDNISPYLGTAPFCGNAAGTAFSCGYMTWMAYNNPNYNVHLLAASLAWNW